ncbi:MAG: hypothetical protein U1F40_15545 [Turneriella sp.]
MSGIVLLTGLVLFFITERQSDKRALELKQFQMENTRIVQQMSKSTERLERAMEQIAREGAQRHDENMTYFQGIMQSIARVIRRQEEGDGAK